MKSTRQAQLKYPWKQAVLDALIEYRADLIRDKLTTAERVISERLTFKALDLEELVALREAWVALQMVFPETKLKIEPAENEEIA